MVAITSSYKQQFDMIVNWFFGFLFSTLVGWHSVNNLVTRLCSRAKVQFEFIKLWDSFSWKKYENVDEFIETFTLSLV